MHERDPFRLLMIALAAAGYVASAAPAVGEEDRSLSRAVYEFAVTGYCGLVDAAVDAGFRAEIAALTARAGLEAEAARRQRIRGWVAAEEEWRNRGLGGQRAWCAEEGASAARRFKAIAGGDLQP